MIAVITCSSCSKLGIYPDDYSLTGTIITDCSGAPLAYDSLRVYYKGGGLLTNNSGYKVYGLTDANGKFTLNIPGKYSMSITVSYKAGKYWNDIVKDYTAPVDGQNHVADLETIYNVYDIFSVFRLNIDTSLYSNQDTLYIGQGHTNYKTIPPPVPSSLILTFKSSVNSSVQALPDSGFYICWGPRKEYYDSMVGGGHFPTDYERHKFYAPAAICQYPDTGYFSIH